MVGIFSRFAAGRASHRRTKSATETRGTQSVSMETRDESSTTSTCKDNDINARIMEFKPIEHPLEPSNHDRPIRCPLPDPSLLDDVMAGKERTTSSSSMEGTSARTRAADDGAIPNSISEPEQHLLITALEDDDSNPVRG